MGSEVIFKENRVEIHSHLEKAYGNDIAKDALSGLTAKQKYIPSKYFYDARGSKLFEEICTLPEYYPTRTEMAILKKSAPVIMTRFRSGDLVELGSGANWKVRTLLDAADRSSLSRIRYVPVDVSKSALREASEELLNVYPDLEVFGIVADFTLHMETIPSERPRLIIFLGSTIGNFRAEERKKFLSRVALSMKQSDRFIVGFDMLKSEKTLEAAYNDSRGVTSAFNKNILNVLNRELRANFNISNFDHLAFFNEEKKRVEMHLQARKKVEVAIDDLGVVVELEEDETIHTEVCGKFSRSDIEKMAEEAGLSIRNWYLDKNEWFAIVEFSL